MDWKANTAYSGGQEAGSEGAFCVANLNDTDGDGAVDASDNVVSFSASGRNEVDLLKIEIANISPNELYDPSKTPLVISNNSDIDIAAYTSPVKNNLDKISFPYTVPEDAIFPFELYIEAKEHSNAMRDIKVVVSKLNQSIQLEATAVWVDLKNVYSSGSSPTAADLNLTSCTAFKVNGNIGSDGSLYGFGYFFDDDKDGSDVRMGARVLYEWQLVPSQAMNFLSIDGSRQKAVNKWDAYYKVDDQAKCDFIKDEGVDDEFPTQIEKPNDDSAPQGNACDDENHFVGNGLFYTYDSPSIWRNRENSQRIPTIYDAFVVSKINFNEWVRIGIGDFDFQSIDNDVAGSICSEKKKWSVSMYAKKNADLWLEIDNDEQSISHVRANDFTKDLITYENNRLEADYELGSYAVFIGRNPAAGKKNLLTTRISAVDCDVWEEDINYQVDIGVTDHPISFDKHDMDLTEQEVDIDYFINWKSFYSPIKTNALQMSHIPDSEFDQK